MPTRFYLPSPATVGPPDVLPAFSAMWEGTADADRVPLRRDPGGSALADQLHTKVTAANPYDALAAQFVSDPLAAQSIAGTMTASICCYEVNNLANLFLQVRVYLVDAAGAFVATLFDGLTNATSTSTVGANNQEFPGAGSTQITNRILNVALTEQSAPAESRLVVELGTRGPTTRVGDTCVHRYGDPIGGTDSPYPTVGAEGTGGALRPWVEFSATITDYVPPEPPGPPVAITPDYRLVVEVGGHTYDVSYGDEPAAPTIALPVSIGWQIPESVDFFPTQSNPTSGSFGIVVDDLATVADIALGDPVSLTMYVPADAVDPWQETGPLCVTQLDAEVGVQGGSRSVLTVYFGESSWLLREMVVGLVDWPEESIEDRVGRIATECGLTLDVSTFGSGMVGTLGARGAGATDALSALRTALKDSALEQTLADASVYGRPVYAYDPSTSTLEIREFERRVVSWPAYLDDEGTLRRRDGEPNALDGCAVEVNGRWSRLPIDRPTYVIVDDVIFGDPDEPGAVPYVRSTSLVDTVPVNPSAVERDTLGESLLPDDVNTFKWRTDTIRHLTYREPAPLANWFGYASGLGALPWRLLRPTFVEPIDPTLTPDGSVSVAGLLSGARLTIPPGGRFYVDVTLRPELAPWIDGTPTGDAATYADIPPALTYADLDPTLTYRDLRLAGA